MTLNTKKEHDKIITPSANRFLGKSTGVPCVYILKCCDGTLYTGWTNDFSKRLKTHNNGKGAKYTRSRLPVTPVYIEHLPDRSSAVKREAAIKKLTRAKKLQLIGSNINEIH